MMLKECQYAVVLLSVVSPRGMLTFFETFSQKCLHSYLLIQFCILTSYGTHLFLDPGKLWVLLLKPFFGSDQY